jgi:hypothetical protein
MASVKEKNLVIKNMSDNEIYCAHLFAVACTVSGEKAIDYSGINTNTLKR